MPRSLRHAPPVRRPFEDIVVPVGDLADTCSSLQELFARYGYDDAVIFGHAKDGNIHFLLTDRFEGDDAIGRYNDFNEGMVDLVLPPRATSRPSTAPAAPWRRAPPIRRRTLCGHAGAQAGLRSHQHNEPGRHLG